MKSIKSIAVVAIIVLSLVACKQEAMVSAPQPAVVVGNVYTTDVLRYEGDIVNNMPNGKGVITFIWGDTYAGDVVNALPNGGGVMRYVDGSIYRGQWKDGLRDGHGRFDSSDGSRYNGSWVAGSKHGQGTLTVDGLSQTGTFEKDQPKRVVVLDTNTCIEGNCRTGYGIKRTADGVYSGDFENGDFHGQGTFKYSNGDTYKGSFLKGHMFGAGRLTSPNNHCVTMGIWERGKWVEGNRRYDDGTPEYILMRHIL
jgi:hypothetical protein